jgi:phytoene synthase
MLGLPFGSSRASRGPVVATSAKSGAVASDWMGRRASSLAESSAWCRRCTQRSRSNFYLSFFTLPRSLFADMCVLYAFMRLTDDLGDDATIPAPARLALIEQWRVQVEHALNGGPFEHPALPALADVVTRHGIPREYLFAVIDGIQRDLEPTGFETFAELSDYCYHVAGAVGLCCLHIWGFSDDRALKLAIDCGLAFQLTNILRDVGEDARMGRCYLPREDLRRFGLTLDDLRARTSASGFRDLMVWEAARARMHFSSAQHLVPLCSQAGRPILDAMLRTYAALLDAIEASGYDVHAQRIRVGRWRKTRIVLGSLWRYRWPRRG